MTTATASTPTLQALIHGWRHASGRDPARAAVCQQLADALERALQAHPVVPLAEVQSLGDIATECLRSAVRDLIVKYTHQPPNPHQQGTYLWARGGLPVRPTKAAVGVCLEGRYATVREQVLAAELLHIRACIERCKSVQASAERNADDWLAKSVVEYDSLTRHSCRIRENVCREVANELAKALEGF